MREGLQSIGVNNTTVAIFETLMDSNSLFLTGNTESIAVPAGYMSFGRTPAVIGCSSVASWWTAIPHRR